MHIKKHSQLICLLELDYSVINQQFSASNTIQYLMSFPWKFLLATTLFFLTVARIPPQKRKFNDSCLEQVILSYKPLLSSKLYEIFENSFPNTLDTTVITFDEQQPLTYIITGDIPAMWLRDSTNQIIPYIKVKRTCQRIKLLVLGLINMQAKFIMIDPYTNAFCQNVDDKQRPFYLNDSTFRKIMGIDVDLTRFREFATRSIWERKYEIDSLASFLRLIYEYNKRYETIDFISVNVIKAIKLIMNVIERESKEDINYQRWSGLSYTFKRSPNELPYGRMASGSRTGMVRSAFRPSDDPNKYPYNIPGNAMLSTYLLKVASILKTIQSPFYKTILNGIPQTMQKFSKRINQSIFDFGVRKLGQRDLFFYEIDGKGRWLQQQDPNLPSLLSLPYIEFIEKQHPIYISTRKFIFSKANPFYYQGNSSYMKGLGSTHTSSGFIWPISVITRALTTDDTSQIQECLTFLKQTSKDNFVHESVNKDNPENYSRVWFAWANSYFGELIVYLAEKFPDLLK